MQQRPLLDLLGARWAISGAVVAAAWSTDGAVAAFALDDGSLALAPRTWPGAARVAQRPAGGIELVPASSAPPPVLRVSVLAGPSRAIRAHPQGGFLVLGADDVARACVGSDGAALPMPDDVTEAGPFAAWSAREGLRVWMTPDATPITLAGCPDQPGQFSIFDEGRMLAAAGEARPVCWRLAPAAGEPIAGGLAGRTPVSAVAGHPHRALLAAGYRHGTVLLCQPTGEEVLFLRAPDGAAITALAWSGDGRRLALGTQGGEAAVLALPIALFRQQEKAA